ncbi:Sas10/Utp3/C1D family-domain-containing protein [Mycena maculata]|uniref:Exosome complex protein n=1 Tax=Mycena maculata TaxID=230809 RepID=A0AAD7NT00_9AGAR|nr:Sas10/Utp3/C1D family-domain-containing protein [Mycena maculata]
MTTETTKLKTKLDSLTLLLSDLESSLPPLFAQTLPETTVALTPIEQAKLQTLLPYLVYDLVFIYLKSKGVDPKTHPVVGELSRVKRYFDKISSAENPDAQRAPLDKTAASRFIKHAITQSTFGQPSGDAPQPAEPSTFVPVKVTSKMAERSEYERELRARGDVNSSEEELEIIDNDEPPVKLSKGKGKAKEIVVEPATTGSKRRRPVIDPFAGFGDDEPLSAQAEEEENDAENKKLRKKEKKKAKKDVEEAASSPKSPKKKAKK